MLRGDGISGDGANLNVLLNAGHRQSDGKVLGRSRSDRLLGGGGETLGGDGEGVAAGGDSGDDKVADIVGGCSGDGAAGLVPGFNAGLGDGGAMGVDDGSGNLLRLQRAGGCECHEGNETGDEHTSP